MSINAQRHQRTQPQREVAPPQETVHESDESRLLKHEVARYVAQMTNELGGMARGANMELLAYFLDMCRVEANVQLERNEA